MDSTSMDATPDTPAAATSSISVAPAGDSTYKSGDPPRAVIKNVDMSEEMQNVCINNAVAAMEKNPVEKDIAAEIKKEFDKKFGPTWHVVVGKNFGSYVTHETKHFIYFYIGNMAFLVWKS